MKNKLIELANSVWWDWLFRLLIVASLVAFGVNYTGDQKRADRLESVVACQQEYNKINNERTRILTEAGQKEREAERKSDDAQSQLWLDPAIGGNSGIRANEWIAVFTDIANGTFDITDADRFAARLRESQLTEEDQNRILRKFRDFQTSLTDLKAERKAADDDRAANPVPPPPEALCGNLEKK